MPTTCARLVLLHAILITAIAGSTACSNGVSTPTSASAATPGTKIEITTFDVIPEIVGTGRQYRVSLRLTETTGRGDAIINSVQFVIGTVGYAPVALQEPVRLSAGASELTALFVLNDPTDGTASVTAMAVTVSYSDDQGRSAKVSRTTAFTQAKR